jgi:thioredoxin 1
MIGGFMTLAINEQNFDTEVLKSNIPVLVDFWAPWCGPCKMISPVIDEISKDFEGKLKVCKVNTDENMNISSKYQVTSIPCLLFLKDGKPVEKVVGFRSKKDLAKIISNILETK